SPRLVALRLPGHGAVRAGTVPCSHVRTHGYVTERGDVAEFSPRSPRFAVVVHERVPHAAGLVERAREVSAHDVHHGGVTRHGRRTRQGLTTYGPQVLGELTRERPLDGPVSAVVRTQRHFVDEDAVVGDEVLNRHDTDPSNQRSDAFTEVEGFVRSLFVEVAGI